MPDDRFSLDAIAVTRDPDRAVCVAGRRGLRLRRLADLAGRGRRHAGPALHPAVPVRLRARRHRVAAPHGRREPAAVAPGVERHQRRADARRRGEPDRARRRRPRPPPGSPRSADELLHLQLPEVDVGSTRSGSRSTRARRPRCRPGSLVRAGERRTGGPGRGRHGAASGLATSELDIRVAQTPAGVRGPSAPSSSGSRPASPSSQVNGKSAEPRRHRARAFPCGIGPQVSVGGAAARHLAATPAAAT